jgi:hypothetical protein
MKHVEGSNDDWLDAVRRLYRRAPAPSAETRLLSHRANHTGERSSPRPGGPQTGLDAYASCIEAACRRAAAEHRAHTRRAGLGAGDRA